MGRHERFLGKPLTQACICNHDPDFDPSELMDSAPASRPATNPDKDFFGSAGSADAAFSTTDVPWFRRESPSSSGGNK